MKKILALLLAALLLFAAGCTAKEADVPENTQTNGDYYEPVPPESPEDNENGENTGEDPVYYDRNSEEYRELYSQNPIEDGMEERFASAMTAEDFEALSIDYRKAWEDEYHALMDLLISLYPDDADDLEGLRGYTDEAAQAAYSEAYAQHLYLDEDGQEQVGVAAVQSGNFAAAEVYHDAAVISILNDYREAEAYPFHYMGDKYL